MLKKTNGHSNSNGRGRHILYRSYNFINKDPVIDKIRTLVAREGIKESKLSIISGVSTTTLHNWFEGQTKRPQYATIAAVVGALGYKQTFVKAKQIDYDKEVARASEEIAETKKKEERRAARQH